MLPKKSKAEKIKELKPAGAGVVDAEEEQFKKDLEEYARLETENKDWSSTISVVQEMVRMKDQAIDEYTLYMKIQRNNRDVYITEHVAKQVEAERLRLNLPAMDAIALRNFFNSEYN